MANLDLKDLLETSDPVEYSRRLAKKIDELEGQIDQIVSSGVPDATTTVKGKLKLAGDLGGTADSPTVPALANKFNTPSGTISQYVRGDGSIADFPALTSGTVITTVFNESGVTIPKMSVVYITGGHGDMPVISLAQANSEATSSKTYGVVVADIAPNQIGQTIVIGPLTGVNTSQFDPIPFPHEINGTSLWLSPTTPGGITTTKPTAPNHAVYIGTIVRTHPNAGVIEVRIQNGYELEELHNVAISSPANNDVLAYDSATSLWKNSSSVSVLSKLSKGTKTIFCIDNGDFATGQAAINAASAGDTILFGAKAGGWGDLVIPAGKKLSLKGLQAARSIYAQIGSITFSPTTGTQIVENELYIESLYLYKATGSVLYFDGTAPARVRVNGCYILSGTGRAVESTNPYSSGGISSSLYIYDSYISSGNNTLPAVESSTPFVRIRKTSVENGSVAIKINAGILEGVHGEFICNSTGNVVEVAAGANFLSNNCLLSNSTTNGSGVQVAATGVFASFLNVFSIATGTGYCVKGSGVHIYTGQNLSNSAALAYNVKMQNTLTNLPYTTTFTAAP